ncbi:hypothetical protein N9I98_03630 [Flavobacteriales bacterium]|jgi:hypothetical protein|nr:hypothetical protein [Flavobacteriales bacterium]
MKNAFVSLLVITGLFMSCKKDKETTATPAPMVLGSWQVVQTQTTHELGHYGPYDPPERVIDSKETLTIDHQGNYTLVDVSSSSLTWTDYDSIPVIHTWVQTADIFSLSSNDTTLDYRIIELTNDVFQFYIKDFRTYNDSTNLVAYEEFQYTYLLEKL